MTAYIRGKIMNGMQLKRIIGPQNCRTILHYISELHNTVKSMIRRSKIDFFNGLTNETVDKDIPDSLKLPNEINISGPDASNEIDSEVIAPTGEFSFVKTLSSEVKKSISRIKTLAMGVDKIDINMIKLCTPYCIPVIKHIINHSFQSSTFSPTWKQFKIIHLGKVSLPTEFKHLRLISILLVMSKIIERISRFRTCHSTYTALLDITDFIYKSIDEGKVTFAIFLDFTKAFDTINHKKLLVKLTAAGLSNDSCKLFENYPENCTQQVEPVINGVPHGSILGPLLFSLYITQLASCFKHVKCYQYADDTQLLLSCRVNETDESVVNINSDLLNLLEWCDSNFLKINPSKCSYIISAAIQSAYYRLKNLYRLKKLLTTDIELLLCDVLDLSDLTTVRGCLLISMKSKNIEYRKYKTRALDIVSILKCEITSPTPFLHSNG
ncbi:hypothetical protein PR048_031505 [Dryococelus australis]|uniref:Reverse transcriptase domain-containing protein n=1 Tax=Dryococelus australis TaxID=614101 RepID=A0ABQ9G8A6_9NEOP|nr:hypothetical protein PR048_031505 [Dryococelus australis]